MPMPGSRLGADALSPCVEADDEEAGATDPGAATFSLGGKDRPYILLYVLTIALPFTGIGAYYFGNEQAGEIHASPLKLLLWLVIVAHVLGVLVHQFYWKTHVLRRMTVASRPCV
ncbi:hypothetical protein ABID21_003276 [Pseudorhizobium tarimense]|uniref:Cytochrome b561 bacterial/Ni-hydrogenase domain-containing protein n=1 Tax=Pseudorhizobium tarimense TaxID=1079109 RepID=A0ABV2H9L3_9HYPH